MTEEDSSSMNWYYDNDNGNGNELPPPEDLIPLSQSLITPDLALAFNISNNSNSHHNRHAPPPQPPPPPPHPNSSSAEFDSSAGGSDEPARTLKRPRLVWTPQLHKRFVDAVAHLGIKNAVPKTIMQLMSVDGLTRENVASHLQKYRLYLKRMQHGMSNSSGSAPDTATDRLFASSPVPPHFLNPDTRVGGGVGGGYLPFVPVPGAMHHHGMAVVAPGVGPGTMHPQFRQFENNHHLLRQQSQQNQLRMPMFMEDLEQPANGRRVLTLFPTADD